MAGSIPLFGAEQLIELTPEQLHTAKITFASVTNVNDSQSHEEAVPALLLSGKVSIPNAALDVVLATVAGRVESLAVNPGQAVRSGQVLARLHSAELLNLQRQFISARARADLARTRVERDEALFADGIIARNRVQERQVEREESAAQLRESRQLLRLAGMSDAAIARIHSADDISAVLVVTARRAGTVLQQGSAPGAAVASGDLLFTIAAPNHLWLELQATRDQSAHISIGDNVHVAGCTTSATVIATGVRLDSQSQTTVVRAEMKDTAGCLSPNQYLEARVQAKPASATLRSVPESGLLSRSGQHYLVVRKGTGLLPVPVTVERRFGGRAWVSGAIAAGDQVASGGLAALKGRWLGLGTVTTPTGAP
jgi:multidrug efflux pump subunit AcrA (membrane-fusion protein)